MVGKEELLSRLSQLRDLIESSETEREIHFHIRRTLGREWEPEINWQMERILLDERARLNRIDKKLDSLLERPAVHCRFSGPGGDEIMQLMTNVGPVERTKAIEHIRGGFSGAKHITICDPFFLRGLRGSTAAQYAQDLDKAIPPTTQSVEIFVKPKERDPDVAACIESVFSARGISRRYLRTKELHDRVWIADGLRAFVVGASFNGLGNKCAFILELPEQDRNQFIAELTNVRTRSRSSAEA